MVGTHHAVLGVDRAAFHNGQQVALHAFARHVGRTLLSGRSGDFVQLVDEYDAALLHALLGCFHDAVFIDQPLGRLLNQNVPGRARLHAFARRAGGMMRPIMVFIWLPNCSMPGTANISIWGAFSLTSTSTSWLSRCPSPPTDCAGFRGWPRGCPRSPLRAARRSKQAFLGLGFGFGAHAFVFLVAHQFDAQVQQIADHGFHVCGPHSPLRYIWWLPP